MPDKRIAIAGATGFAGIELYRLLYNHPEVEVTVITSESRAGMSYRDVYPHIRDLSEHSLVSADQVDPDDVDLFFLALPHGASMDYVKEWKSFGKPIIDLSGDFRLADRRTYEDWYGMEHNYPEGFETAVYGLTEWHREELKKSNLIANPGCYPTSVLMAIIPLVREGIVDPGSFIADSKSGVTGAGAGLKESTHFATTHDNFNAYGFPNHRHTIEMEQGTQRLTNAKTQVQFTPHLIPANRGILSTIYATPKGRVNTKMLNELYHETYGQEYFVRLAKEPVEINQVRATNFCDLYPLFDERTGRIIVLSVIDNLVKGAAGQAIQNMNVRMGWSEQLGLNTIPVVP